MSTITPQDAERVLSKADLLFSTAEVESALDNMAREIAQQLAGSNPILVCVMTGGVVPFGIVLPRLKFPLQIDYVHATRYGKQLVGGQLQWIAGPHQSPRGRTVLLIDDILDEGTTLAGIESRYRHEGAHEVYKAVLVVKDRARPQEIAVDFKGLEVPDRYVFGYGMDYKGFLRNAPGIYAEASS